MTPAAPSMLERAIAAAGAASVVQADLPLGPSAAGRDTAIRVHAAAARDHDGLWSWCADSRPLPALADRDDFTALARSRALPVLPLAAPLPLQPARIEKPWGAEEWFTGIEARGEARVGPVAPGLPLSWLLAALPERNGGLRVPLLAKRLLPHDDPEFGDLYFELHQRKEELYLVTGVDAQRWPDGGRLRLGLCPRRLGSLDEAAVRRGFRADLERYRSIRRRIDAQLAARRAAEGLPAAAVVPPQLARRWLDTLPAGLRAEEAAGRRRVEGWIGERTVRPGDAIRVAPGVPHGLRHGIRVLELQTPDYERQILYFNQPVLSPDRTDLSAACHSMHLAAPPCAAPAPAGPGPLAVELLAEIDGWQIQRWRFVAAHAALLPAGACAVLIGLEGECRIGSTILTPERALWLPAPLLGRDRLSAAAGASVLLALAGPGR